MPGYRKAFISYQTEDRAVAGSLRAALEPAGIEAFLAHEDINVSVIWRDRLLAELHAVDIFVAVLSAAYYRSHWCIQESGIAAFKPDLLVIPLSLDGTTPPAFLSGFQSTKIDPERITPRVLAPAFTTKDSAKGLFNLISLIARSTNYRDAEANFALLMPHLPDLDRHHVIALLEAANSNDQVSNASQCATEFIPSLLRKHPRGGSHAIRAALKATSARYGGWP